MSVSESSDDDVNSHHHSDIGDSEHVPMQAFNMPEKDTLVAERSHLGDYDNIVPSDKNEREDLKKYMTALAITENLRLRPHAMITPLDENGEETEGEPIMQNHDIWAFTDYKQYGLGTQLYFSTVRKVFWLFFMMSILSLPSMYFYFHFDGIDPSHSTIYSLEKVSIGNLGDESVFDDPTREYLPEKMIAFGIKFTRKEVGLYVSIFDCIISLFVAIYIWYCIRLHNRSVVSHRLLYPSIKDYTVRVGNLTKYFQDRIALANFFERLFGTVKEVVLRFKENSYFYEPRFRYRKLKKDLIKLETDPEADDIDKKLIQDELQAIEDMIEGMPVQDKPTECAFVTFNDVKSRIDCVTAYKSNLISYIKRKRNDDMYFDNRMLIVDNTVEPSHIRSDSFALRTNSSCYIYTLHYIKRFSLFLSYMFIFAVTAVASYMNTVYRRDGFKNNSFSCPLIDDTTILSTMDNELRKCACRQIGWLDMLNEKRIDCNDQYNELVYETIAVALLSIVIAVGNICIIHLTSISAYYDYAKDIIDIQKRHIPLAALALFVNSIVVPVLDNADLSYYFHNTITDKVFNGPYDDMNGQWYSVVGVLIILVTVTTAILYWVSFWMKEFVQYMRWKRCNVSQTIEEWYNVYKPQGFRLCERYSLLLFLIYAIFAFGGGMPLLYVCGCFCCLSMYWCDKIGLLRFYATPSINEEGIDYMFLLALSPAVLLHVCGSIWIFTSPILYDVYKSAAISLLPVSSGDMAHRLQQLHIVPLLTAMAVILLLFLFFFIFGFTLSIDSILLHTEETKTIDQLEIKLSNYFLDTNDEYGTLYDSNENDCVSLPADLRLIQIRPDIHNRKFNLNPAQMQEVKEIFDRFDADMGGTISSDELRSALSNMGMEPTEDDIMEMLNSVEVNAEGEISFPAFCKMMAEQINMGNEQSVFENPIVLTQDEMIEALKEFQKFASKSTGFISNDQVLLTLLTSLNSDIKTLDIFHQADLIDNWAEISFYDFCDLLSFMKERKKDNDKNNNSDDDDDDDNDNERKEEKKLELVEVHDGNKEEVLWELWKEEKKDDSDRIVYRNVQNPKITNVNKPVTMVLEEVNNENDE